MITLVKVFKYTCITCRPTMSSLIKPLWYFGVNFFLLKKMYECEHATAVTLKCDSCLTANTLQLLLHKKY